MNGFLVSLTEKSGLDILMVSWRLNRISDLRRQTLSTNQFLVTDHVGATDANFHGNLREEKKLQKAIRHS